MYDNVNGARLASKRAQKAFGITASIAKEAVARAGGWQDWHGLEATVGTPRAPRRPAWRSLSSYLREHAAHVGPDALIDVALPGHGEQGTRTIYDLAEFGPSRSPMAIMTGLPLAPGANALRHFPIEVRRIEVMMKPANLDMDDHSVNGVLDEIAFGFEDGPTLVMTMADIISCSGTHPMRQVDPAELNGQPNEHMDMPYGDMCRLLANNANMLFAMEDVPIAAGFVADRDQGQTLVMPDEDPEVDALAERLRVRLESSESQSRLATAISAHARTTLEKGRMVREMYQAEVQGRPMMRQRFNPEPWPETLEVTKYGRDMRRTTRSVAREEMTFGDIQGEISPDTVRNSPAHMMHGDALGAVLMRHAREELAAETAPDHAFEDERLGWNEAFWRVWQHWINLTKESLKSLPVAGTAKG